LPELKRNILTKYILQNIIKHNREPNQTVLKGNNRRMSVSIRAREIDNRSNTYNKTNREKSQVQNGYVRIIGGFQQVLNSINQYKLWKAMTQLGISAKLVKLVKACAQHSKCKVKFNIEFSVETGLRQGDPLSPTLFIIALESVVREVLNDVMGQSIADIIR